MSQYVRIARFRLLLGVLGAGRRNTPQAATSAALMNGSSSIMDCPALKPSKLLSSLAAAAGIDYLSELTRFLSSPQWPGFALGRRRLQQHARHIHAAGAFVTNQSRFAQSWLDAHHIVHGGSTPRA